MRQTSLTPTAQSKKRIQALARAIGIVRDGGCVFRDREINGAPHYCSGWRGDGQVVLQYDHLNSRRFSVSFADVRLGVIICRGLHGWKKWNKEIYDEAVREVIGPERTALWDIVKKDRKSYLMTSWDWAKVEIALTKDLEEMKGERVHAD